MEGTETRRDASRLPPPQHPPLAGKSLNSLGKLDACQERAYKQKRKQGFTMKRAEFALSQMLSAREKRLLERGGRNSKVKTVVEKFQKFDQRHRYISNRATELETRLGKTAEDIARLDASMSNDVRVLLFPQDAASPSDGTDAAPVGESALSEDGTPPSAAATALPVSENQLSRLMSQAQATSLLLKGELEHDKLQLQLMKEAEVVAQTEKPLTDADLAVADAKTSTLMDKAAAVRKNLPQLGIAANVVESSSLGLKPGTTLGWTREFRRLGGFFRRDERGV